MEETAASSTSAPVVPVKRKRPRLACDNCRKAKVRCNGEQPCDRCAKKKRECTYTSPTESRKRAKIGESSVDCDDETHFHHHNALLDAEMQSRYLDLYMTNVAPLLMMRLDRDTILSPTNRGQSLQHFVIMTQTAQAMKQQSLARALRRRARAVLGDIFDDLTMDSVLGVCMYTLMTMEVADPGITVHYSMVTASLAKQLRNQIVRDREAAEKGDIAGTTLEPPSPHLELNGEELGDVLSRLDKVMFIVTNLRDFREPPNLQQDLILRELRERYLPGGEAPEVDPSVDLHWDTPIEMVCQWHCLLHEGKRVCHEVYLALKTREPLHGRASLPAIRNPEQILGDINESEVLLQQYPKIYPLIPLFQVGLAIMRASVLVCRHEDERARSVLRGGTAILKDVFENNDIIPPPHLPMVMDFMFEIALHLREMRIANEITSILLGLANRLPGARTRALQASLRLKEAALKVVEEMEPVQHASAGGAGMGPLPNPPLPIPEVRMSEKLPEAHRTAVRIASGEDPIHTMAKQVADTPERFNVVSQSLSAGADKWLEEISMQYQDFDPKSGASLMNFLEWSGAQSIADDLYNSRPHMPS